jgi:hypothetical protein
VKNNKIKVLIFSAYFLFVIAVVPVAPEEIKTNTNSTMDIWVEVYLPESQINYKKFINPIESFSDQENVEIDLSEYKGSSINLIVYQPYKCIFSERYSDTHTYVKIVFVPLWENQWRDTSFRAAGGKYDDYGTGTCNFGVYVDENMNEEYKLKVTVRGTILREKIAYTFLIFGFWNPTIMDRIFGKTTTYILHLHV